MTKTKGPRNHIKTRDIRTQVIDLKLAGYKDNDIARLMKIGVGTLRKHYSDDLLDAESRLERAAVTTIYEEAKSGNLDASKFIMDKMSKNFRKDPAGVNINLNIENREAKVKQLQDHLAKKTVDLNLNQDNIYTDVEAPSE